MTDERHAAGKRWHLTHAAFSSMLERLAGDSESAGLAFEELRRRLIIFFSCESLSEPETWADETLDRVARRLADGTCVENINAFTKGVARLVRHEALQARSRETRSAVEFGLHQIRTGQSGSAGDIEARHKRLEDCLQRVPAVNRKLVIEYYEGQKGARIVNRQRMASQLGITVESLRNKALGIRKQLERCMADDDQNEGDK